MILWELSYFFNVKNVLGLVFLLFIIAVLILVIVE
jgi:hypothetical protein